ncbi:MAG TPA: VanW family protein [Candidatus Limnocylindrales bacterium]|nr:VanW family protein [Candidatus Limnocylindrales bacterium]
MSISETTVGEGVLGEVGVAAGVRPARRARLRVVARRVLGLGLGFLVGVTAAAVLAGVFVVSLARLHDGRIVPGVQVGGVSLAGLDGPAAEERLRSGLPSLSSGQLTLRFEGRTRQIRYAALGRDYDTQAMLDAAFAVGRGPDDTAATLDGLRSLARGTEVPLATRLDRAALERWLAATVATFESPPRDAAVVLSADKARFEVLPAAAGRRAAARELAASLAAALALPDAGDISVDLSATSAPAAVSTGDAAAAAALAERIAARPLPITDGRRTVKLTPATIRRWIAFELGAEGYRPVLVERLVKGSLGRLADRFRVEPGDARFVKRGQTVIGFLASRPGHELDVAGSLPRVLAALEARAAGVVTPGGEDPVDLATDSLAPALTSEEAGRLAPLLVRLSTWTTPYVPSEKNYFGANIKVPTRIIDGYILMPGEWFDFWRAVGEVSTSRGYGPGGVIRNGRTEPTGALAGGICSCSTTLFNAAARAGLDLGERHNHWYYITRYPVGLDATVLKGSRGPIQNMTFRNDTGKPLLIRGINGYGRVTFEIYGVPTGRKVSFSRPIIRNRVPARDTVQYTSTLPTGVRKRVEYPADGFDVWVTRTVRDAQGRILHQETFYSHYGRVDGVVLIGR